MVSCLSSVFESSIIIFFPCQYVNQSYRRFAGSCGSCNITPIVLIYIDCHAVSIRRLREKKNTMHSIVEKRDSGGESFEAAHQEMYFATLSRTTRFTVDCVWNVMAHAQKAYFVFRGNRRVHLNRRGRQFSWLLAAEVCASAVVMLDTPCSEVVWRVVATHCFRQFPLLHPCDTVCHRVSTGLYRSYTSGDRIHHPAFCVHATATLSHCYMKRGNILL